MLRSTHTGSLYSYSGKTLAFAVVVLIEVPLLIAWSIVTLTHRREQSNEELQETRSLLGDKTSERRMLKYRTLLSNHGHMAAQLLTIASYTNLSFIEPQLSSLMHSIDDSFTQG